MSYTTSFADEKSGIEFDLLQHNYLKLPFCDEEDITDFPEFWSEDKREGGLCYDIQYHHSNGSPLSPSDPHSPSSLSSGSSGGQNQTDHAHSLLKERPDTPLTAVKFEEFSNGFGLHDLGYPGCEELNLSHEVDAIFDVDDNLTPSSGLDLKPFDDKISDADAYFTNCLSTGSERTMDRSLASTVTSCSENNATITISKAKDGRAMVKSSVPVDNVKEEIIEFSFSKNQPVISCANPAKKLLVESSNLQTTTSNNISSVFLSDQTTASKLIPVKCTTSPSTAQKFTLEELMDTSDLITLPPNQKIKVAPQARITRNTFTHKAQIQIPTATLQTLLKNGAMVTRLQQDGQYVSKIRIKTEANDDSPTFVKIAQPQSDLPPTPPSSASSDAEGSSSPRLRGDDLNSSLRQATHICVQSSSSQLANQLLTSTQQRFAQNQGPLVLTEEERRTLIAEGYAVPTKLPLSKSEEKSLKKIRRKIKNKLSAQESRRKKREYVETLEKKMDVYNRENMDLKRKLDSLENSNRSLLSQLRSLQTLVAGKMPKPSRTVTTQTSSCLMMIVLCFAVFLGGWYPQLSPFGSSKYNSDVSRPLSTQHSTGNWYSRVLTSFKAEGSCYDDEHFHGNELCFKREEAPNDRTAGGDRDVMNGGEETYDAPTGGRITMNDTGDQTSKIIANTMEPRTAADILASRKVVIQGSKMEVVVDPDALHDLSKKINVVAQLVTE